MNKILEFFNKWTKVAKNVVWWYLAIGAYGFVVIFYITKLDDATRIFYGIISVLVILLVWIGVSYWQLKNNWKRVTRSFQQVHRLTHNLRENIGKQCQPTWDKEWTKKITNKHLKSSLVRILDDGADCLTELTGQKITSCLLMPVGQRKGTGNLVFKTIKYGGNPRDDRCKGSRIHERDVIQHAFYEQKPIIHYDYEKESQQGIFVPVRPDWREYYMSSLMTSFSVGNELTDKTVWGVLSFDCLKKKVFKKDWQYLVCAFSDALGLVLSLQDPYSNQWSVSKEL